MILEGSDFMGLFKNLFKLEIEGLVLISFGKLFHRIVVEGKNDRSYRLLLHLI